MVHIIPSRSIECIDLNCFQQLPCVRYFTVPSVWKVVEGVFCLVLLLFYRADIMLIGRLF